MNLHRFNMPTTIREGLPLVPPSLPRTPTKHRPHLTRDQRLLVMQCRLDDMGYTAIARKLGLSIGQVYYTCEVSKQATPKHRKRPQSEAIG